MMLVHQNCASKACCSRPNSALVGMLELGIRAYRPGLDVEVVGRAPVRNKNLRA